MKTIGVVIGTLLFAAATIAQDSPSRVGYRGENMFEIGGEFFVETKSTWEAEEAEVEKVVAECVYACQGKIHTDHTKCDGSCDKQCPAGYSHLNRNDPYAEELDSKYERPPSSNILLNIGRILSRMGAPTVASTRVFDFSQVLNIQRVFIRGSDYPNTIRSYVKYYKHWNSTHCSAQKAYAKYKPYRVKLEWHLYYLSGNKKEEGGTGTSYFRINLPINDNIRLDDVITDCKCQITPDAPTEHGYIPGQKLEGQGYALVTESGLSRPMLWKDINIAISSIAVLNMNQAIFHIPENITSTYHFPAGWELECQDGKTQNVQLQDDLMIMPRFAGQSIIVNTKPTSGSLAEIPLKVLCLEMNKPEPKIGIKYNLVPPKNPAHRNLANIVKNSRFRGPWDQMRLWIATDLATYDQMAKVLIPMPGKGTYLRELHRTVTAGALIESNEAVINLAEPQFLAADLFDPPAAAWLVQTNLRANQAEIIKWLDSNAKSLAQHFTKSNLENQPPDGEIRIGTIVSELMAEPDLEKTQAAIKLLAIRPANMAEKEKSSADFVIATALQTSSDEKVATVVLDWIELKKPAAAINSLKSLHPALPLSIKERAAKILDSYPKTGA